MQPLTRVCFMCFSDNNLKIVFNDKESLVAEQIKFVLPELINLELNPALHMCPKCCTDLNVTYVFKKKCLEKYYHFNSYIQQKLQQTSETETDLAIKEENKKPLMVQEDMLINIKQEPEDEPEEPQDELASCEETVKSEFVFVKCELGSEIEEGSRIEGQKEEETVVEQDVNKTQENCRFKCTICNKKFTLRCRLTAHLKIHSTLNEFQCSICSKQFNYKAKLKWHMKTHDVREYSCSICNKDFLRPYDLKEHVNIHTIKEKISCTICQKLFSTKKTLKLHMKMHTGNKEFSCNICHKQFYQNAKLILHMKVHTGVKEYKCDICEKYFLTKNTLQAHNNHHHTSTRGKNYKCTQCNKHFLRKQSLARHMKVHAGVRDFKCTICGKEFGQKYHLQSHINYIHPWFGKA